MVKHPKGIYSPLTKETWVTTAPMFKKKELLLNSYQVMQRWEYNYMKSLAAVVTSKGGTILEVGFGMGISAGLIQQSNKIIKHYVMECHPAMQASAQRMYKRNIAKGRLEIVKGFWEETAKQFPDKFFDGILFDSCPLDSGVEFFQFFPFFKEAFRLLKDGGIFTYFSDEPAEISRKHRDELRSAGFADIAYKICKVRPPANCEYWKHSSIVVPIIHK